MEAEEPLLNCSGKPPEVIKSLCPSTDVSQPPVTEVVENGSVAEDKHLVNGSSHACEEKDIVTGSVPNGAPASDNSNDSAASNTETVCSAKAVNDVQEANKPDITKSDSEISLASSTQLVNGQSNNHVTNTLSTPDKVAKDAAAVTIKPVTSVVSTAGNTVTTVVASTSGDKVTADVCATTISTNTATNVTSAECLVAKSPIAVAKKSTPVIKASKSPTGMTTTMASNSGGGSSIVNKASPMMLRPMAGLLYDIGLDLCKQQVYKDLIRIQARKQSQNRLSKREVQQLNKLRTAHDHMCQRNKSLSGASVRCSRCAFTAASACALRIHDVSGECGQNGEHGGDHACAWCDFSSPHLSAYTCHLEMVHHARARVVVPMCAFTCAACSFETESRGLFGRHARRCDKTFRSKRNLEPMPADCDIPLKMTKLTPAPQRKPMVPAVRPLPPRPPTQPVPQPRMMMANAVGSRMPQVVQVGRQLYTMVNQSGQTLLTPYPLTVPVSTAPNSSNYGKGSVSTLLQQQRAGAAMQNPVVRPLQATHSLVKPSASSSKTAPQQFEICEICGGYVKDRASLGVHFYWAHRIELDAAALADGRQPHLWCDVCRQRFWTYQGLSRHRSVCVPNSVPAAPRNKTAPALSRVRCAICGANNIERMLSHLETTHGISLDAVLTRGSCVTCGDALAGTRAAAQAHFQRAHPALLAAMFSETVGIIRITERTAGCSQCDIVTQSFDALVKHVLTKHIHACAHCSQRWSTARGLLEHERDAHPNIPPRKCPLCSQRLRGNREFLRHVRRLHLRRLTVDVKRLSPSVCARYASKDDVIEVEEEPLIVEEHGNALVLKKMQQR